MAIAAGLDEGACGDGLLEVKLPFSGPVARASVLYSEVNDLADLNPTVEKQIEAFCVNYQSP